MSFHITCSDGHAMPVYSWLPEVAPRLVVYIIHGMSEYAERYEGVAVKLVAAGMAVYAHDHRAHGKAVTSNTALGIAEPGWFYQQIEDMRLVIAHCRKEHPATKLVMMGHSMGSFIAQRFFQMYGTEMDGLVLSATNGAADPLLRLGIGIAWIQMKLLGGQSRSRLIDILSFQKYNKAFSPNRTEHDWLSRDETEVDRYAADPLCGFVCNGAFFHYFFKGIDDALKQINIQKMPRHLPVYAFAGNKDPVGLAGKGFLELVKKWKAAGVSDIEYQLYLNGRHESFHEINKDEVMKDLLAWLQKHF